MGPICLLQLYTCITNATSSNLLLSFKRNDTYRHNFVSQLYVLTAAVKKIMPHIKTDSKRHFKNIGK